MNEKISSWNRENLGTIVSPSMRMFPTEYILRSFMSTRYFPTEVSIQAGMRVLDIGCLYCNNLVPFFDRGCDLCGVEINDEMLLLAQQSALAWQLNVDIQKGNNKSIPFSDKYFDIILSINTLHYEDGSEGIHAALDELSRVGKERSHYLISTVALKHIFHKTATRVDENRYRLMTDDFRDGQIMAYFDSRDHLYKALVKHFQEVHIATITEEYPQNPLQFWVAKCLKIGR